MSKLIALTVLTLVASCGGSQVNENVMIANREDRAHAMCTKIARSHNLRVTSTAQPIQIDPQRFEVGMRTRDATGVADRRCIANVETGKAGLI